MPTEFLNWATIGNSNQATNFTGTSFDTGVTNVAVRLVETGDEQPGDITGSGLQTGDAYTSGNYAGGVGSGFSANSALYLDNSGGSDFAGQPTVAVRMNFTTENTGLFKNAAQNVSFWITDMDESNWRDTVTVRAYDLSGNLVPITFSNIGSNMAVTGNGGTAPTATVPANGISLSPTDARGAFKINIAGPISYLQINYGNVEQGGQFVLVSNVRFDTVPADILPCFVAGTRIRTQNGDCPVETLQIGDMVITRDNGPQPIRWIGMQKVQASGDKFSPIIIDTGVLGNSRPLMVSPEHRVMLGGAEVSLLFGEAEVLVAAQSLIDGKTVVRREGGEVIYFHILFDRHELIWAEDCLAESFHPGDSATDGTDAGTRAEILTLFPELNNDPAAYGPTARTCLKPAEAQLLLH